MHVEARQLQMVLQNAKYVFLRLYLNNTNIFEDTNSTFDNMNLITVHKLRQ